MTLTHKRVVVCGLLMLLLGLTVTGCSNWSNLIGTGRSDVTLVQSPSQREMSPSVTKDALTKLGVDNSAFAFDLYRAIRSKSGNLFYSPYSISIALAMTFAGARNNTERQMARALHYTLPQDLLHPAFNALDLQLVRPSQDSKDKESFKLRTANSIWGQEGYSFRPEFLDVIAKNYGAGLRLLNFMDESQREESRSIINKWVSNQTEGNIKELIEKGILTQDTRLVLANAIYFMAEWKVPFLDGTRNDTFYLLDGTPITVPMMSRRTMTNYARGTGFQAIEIAYKDERMRMLILLPAQGELDAFERSLTSEQVSTILQALKPSDVQVVMPKFKYEANQSLAKTLSDLGMPEAFTPYVADFSGMDGTRKLYISHVVHKALVAVDEKGTEAAAATGVSMQVVSLPVMVKVDRPFIFLIRDAESGTILFVGRVVDPRMS